MRRVAFSLLTSLVVGLSAVSAQADHRSVVRHTTLVYPPMPPGVYYPVAQGLFGRDRGQTAPVYVYVNPEPRRTYYPVAAHRPAISYGLKDRAYADLAPPPASAPWMNWAARGAYGDRSYPGMVRYGCRGCLLVDAGQPVLVINEYRNVTRKAKPRPRPAVEHPGRRVLED